MFYCYNSKLRRFITESGIKWLSKGINSNSGCPYWKFERSEELDSAISKYKSKQ